jgi:hypothetical protein
MRTRHLLLTAAATITLLAGCAAPGTGTGAPASADGGSMPASASPGPTGGSPVPSGGYSLPPSKGVPSAGQSVTVTGTVEAGVEAKCLILRADSVTYQLVDGDPAVVFVGAHLTITGVLRPDIRSYCMQGIPLQVSRAQPAPSSP